MDGVRNEESRDYVYGHSSVSLVPTDRPALGYRVSSSRVRCYFEAHDGLVPLYARCSPRLEDHARLMIATRGGGSLRDLTARHVKVLQSNLTSISIAVSRCVAVVGQVGVQHHHFTQQWQ